MKRAVEKLNSHRGASILLALVFVLACVMVGVSILSAAASNAGRTRSNHEEQQLYLSLSSALQLVADDLARTTYTPQVSHSCDVDTREVEIPGTEDENGDPEKMTITTYSHSFSNADGLVEGGSLGGLFQKSLDMVFNTAMSGISFASYNYDSGDEEFRYSGSFPSGLPTPFTLTVAPKDLPVTEDEDAYDAAREVAVDVEIDESYHITLTAHLSDDGGDSYAGSFRLSTDLTRSSSSLPDFPIPSYPGPDPISASPAVTWKQGVIKSAYKAGGAVS